MISFWDDYNLLVLESDVLKLFSTGTAVVGMQDAIEADVEIAPNPATDYINFTVNMISDEAELAVYTITGKTVYKTTVINGQNLIDTKDLSQGTYVLKLTANNRQIFTDKLIIK